MPDMVFLFKGARAPKGPGSHRPGLVLPHCLLHRMPGVAPIVTVLRATGSWLGIDDGSHPKSHEGLPINFLECIDVKAELKQDTSNEEK